MFGIIGLFDKAYAYSKEGMSMEIDPVLYEIEEGVWISSESENMRIEIVENTKNKIETGTILREYAKQLKEQLENVTIVKAELSEINGYKCLYIQTSPPGVSIAKYIIPTKNKIYTIVLAGTDEDIFSDVTRRMLETFKIEDYEEPTIIETNDFSIDEVQNSKIEEISENVVETQNNNNSTSKNNNIIKKDT